MTYRIQYKHDDHGSDMLPVACDSPAAAKELIKAIQANPGREGFADWLADADKCVMWATDDDGNFV